MSYQLLPYDRKTAAAYAHRWAYGRNPRYYNYERIGGDCTNFASQCLYAGCRIMNYTPTFGWYYLDANNKAPAWTGVEYLFRFLTRDKPSTGPTAALSSLGQLEIGDIIQLSFDGRAYQHSPVVVEVGEKHSAGDILLAAHSDDADYRPLDTYSYALLRPLHIKGYLML